MCDCDFVCVREIFHSIIAPESKALYNNNLFIDLQLIPFYCFVCTFVCACLYTGMCAYMWRPDANARCLP